MEQGRWPMGAVAAVHRPLVVGRSLDGSPSQSLASADSAAPLLLTAPQRAQRMGQFCHPHSPAPLSEPFRGTPHAWPPTCDASLSLCRSPLPWATSQRCGGKAEGLGCVGVAASSIELVWRSTVLSDTAAGCALSFVAECAAAQRFVAACSVNGQQHFDEHEVREGRGRPQPQPLPIPHCASVWLLSSATHCPRSGQRSEHTRI